MSKKLVTRYQYIDLEDSLDELIVKLQKAREKGWQANELCPDPDPDSPCSERSNYLTKQELETDEEYAKRTAAEKEQRQRQNERDAREYTRLQAKFEKAPDYDWLTTGPTWPLPE